MISISYSKIAKGLFILLVIVVLAMPDVVFEWLTELFHSIAEMLGELSHLMFEGLEAALDFLIEHVLETDRHNTQIVVFYIIIVILLGVAFRLFKWLRGVYRGCVDRFMVFWEVNKARAYLFWYGMGLMDRIKLVTVLLAAITGYVLFLM